MTDPKKPPDPATGGAMFLASAGLRSRYGGKSHMWIERQLDRDPSFPRPDFYIGGKRFWRIAKLEAWEAMLPREPPKWLALGSERATEAAKARGKKEPKAEAAPAPVGEPPMRSRRPRAPPVRATAAEPVA
jgi:hypothetical protein